MHARFGHIRAGASTTPSRSYVHLQAEIQLGEHSLKTNLEQERGDEFSLRLSRLSSTVQRQKQWVNQSHQATLTTLTLLRPPQSQSTTDGSYRASQYYHLSHELIPRRDLWPGLLLCLCGRGFSIHRNLMRGHKYSSVTGTGRWR
jgi:hypothetical protein